jgi:hypothetical protein
MKVEGEVVEMKEPGDWRRNYHNSIHSNDDFENSMGSKVGR